MGDFSDYASRTLGAGYHTTQRDAIEWAAAKNGEQAGSSAALLGLAWPASAEEVKKAYRAAVMRNHPDTAKGAPRISMADLQAARDTLLKLVEKSEDSTDSKTCFVCKGSGRVMHGFVAEPCSSCGGTGAIKNE